ncbi:MAG: T9SS type A sorting domain-containing protein [Candidatus Margulisbacteria bacterium]|nr:T9SS type A sorting domain-containing protein [Candidatus Margulisiibacteriota bacterium]MBU1617396.1 T9SS type A sorting domain-containing protein [Candidatus Margulisiibacteriota bacterium]
MRLLLVIVCLVLFLSPGFAYSTSPEALTMGPATSTGTNFINYGVAGESIAGLICSGSYGGSVGLASMVYTPLFPQAGGAVAIIPSGEGETLVYPNPFIPESQPVTIAYKYATDAPVKAYIFDLSGSLIRLISDTSANRGSDGYSRVVWDGRSVFGEAVDNGVYFVRVVVDGRTIAKTKVVAIK